ncbi:MAG TPA: biosynthetic arginine decarboxylase, partial [Gammaproteobacteria bacterium]|nr:biosynthetic arginine decarboxylase [Gammaproteobacteria bacterium]
QISNIRDIHNGMREAARYYVQLVKLGVPLRVVDVGGGLGVDYEGSRSRNFCSMNYSVDEYAQQIVQTLAEACDAEDVTHPDILSESGRALTAHHALLITNLTDVEQAPGTEAPSEPGANVEVVIQDLWQVYSQMEQRSVLESWHDAAWRFGEACSLFDHGVLDLTSRALAEQLYYAIARRLQPMLNPVRRTQRQLLDELNETLADKYFFNFSLFKSLPDVWAIQQVFPIMPLHRLDERPDRRVVVQDLTCDSDGRIDQYVDHDGLESTLALHTQVNDAPYLIGLFLVGAYQEILGDMHNLFGDTDSVNVLFERDGYRLEDAELGDTVDQVLRYVHLDAQDLLSRLQEKTDLQDLDEGLRSSYLDELEEGLRGYTYLEE